MGALTQRSLSEMLALTQIICISAFPWEVTLAQEGHPAVGDLCVHILTCLGVGTQKRFV